MPLSFEQNYPHAILNQCYDELLDIRDLDKCVILLGRLEHHELMGWIYNVHGGCCGTFRQEYDSKTEEWIWRMYGVKAVFNMRVESQVLVQELDHES
jgi:hypothetical protein